MFNAESALKTALKGNQRESLQKGWCPRTNRTRASFEDIFWCSRLRLKGLFCKDAWRDLYPLFFKELLKRLPTCLIIFKGIPAFSLRHLCKGIPTLFLSFFEKDSHFSCNILFRDSYIFVKFFFKGSLHICFQRDSYPLWDLSLMPGCQSLSFGILPRWAPPSRRWWNEIAHPRGLRGGGKRKTQIPKGNRESLTRK